MKSIEIITNKIEELNRLLSQGSGKEKLQSKFDILEECEKALLNEEEILNFDFTKIIEILKDLDLNIEDLEKIIKEIKQVIEVKKAINLPELNFSEIQTSVLSKLNENLIKAKEIIEQNLKQANEEPESTEEIQTTIKILEELKAILLKEGKKKYYTDEMINIFFGIVDWNSLSKEDFDAIISEFYTTQNLQSKLKKEKANLEDVIDLYREFLDESEFRKNENGKYIGLFASLICDHEEEITTCIDLDRTREILQFFKEVGILTTFSQKRPSILKISLFANSEYVKKLYDKIKNEHPDDMDLYFEDETATLWICESSKTRKRPFRVRRDKGTKKKETLYSKCHTISDEDFWNNVKLLNQNAGMFSDKYDVTNFGAHLRAKTLSDEELKYYEMLFNLVTKTSWYISKNLELLKTFNMGEVYKIPVSILENGDIEDKIHLAIELGLLNPPMSLYYKELEKDISNNDAFQNISNKKKIANNSIRNYFTRNMSSLVKYGIQDFGFLAYKLETLGPVGFYNYFLSENKAGQSAYDEIKKDLKENFHGKEEEFIKQNFIIDFCDLYIENYAEYDYIISEHNNTIKTQYDTEMEYFDTSILEEELIKTLEENHTVIDVIFHNGNNIEVKNEFVYKFGDILISRYKVLHNATILKDKYGFLDYNMLMTSIVRNSYLSESSFEMISESLRERNMVC